MTLAGTRQSERVNQVLVKGLCFIIMQPLRFMLEGFYYKATSNHNSRPLMI